MKGHRWSSAKTIFARILLLAMLAWAIGPIASVAAAAEPTHADEAALQAGALVSHLDAGDSDAAAQDLAAIKKWWAKDKNDVKQQSLDLALEIDGQIAALSLAMVSGKLDEASSQAGNLRFSVTNLRDGAFADNDGNSRMTLSTYILKLREAGDLAKHQQWDEAGLSVKQLQQQWLSVEGDVVSQSQRVYNDTERDLVMLDGYLSNPDQRELAAPIIDRLVEGLAPLADAQYSWWDAALIPIREGMEGLLVVGALLMYAKRAGSKPAKRWVVGGSVTGLLASICAGFAVVLLLSSSAFGHNNLLINGWTGVCASVMLLYVSYWLHRHSDTKRFNRLLAERSTRALSGGHMFSLALLSFFSIVREGLETVIFLIGMASKMSATELVAGIAAGFLVLAVAAAVIAKAGSRLPIRPFFLGSSVIVFYLCFKFMGSGIHSLQMAGVLPSTVNEALPDFTTLSLYPSWYSTLPQLVFLACGCTAVVWSLLRSKRRSAVQLS
ncbi:high-affinity iron transporter [Cohnella sp. OV330]|uniref:FTR1 family iron permease n=1 Tax=Cohnella sp. OV330 TaxID=1855288 RepID=UPI0008E705AC|nr:FTR1 family protein [Cohnella sp. OV330]SFB41554.1 high-affinity iron transporter [Cohnella sp. OV330]